VLPDAVEPPTCNPAATPEQNSLAEYYVPAYEMIEPSHTLRIVGFGRVSYLRWTACPVNEIAIQVHTQEVATDNATALLSRGFADTGVAASDLPALLAAVNNFATKDLSRALLAPALAR
jgi:hypothetical protein